MNKSLYKILFYSKMIGKTVYIILVGPNGYTSPVIKATKIKDVILIGSGLSFRGMVPLTTIHDVEFETECGWYTKYNQMFFDINDAQKNINDKSKWI